MKFETPIVEVKKFDVMDILTASGDPEPSLCLENTVTPCDD